MCLSCSEAAGKASRVATAFPAERDKAVEPASDTTILIQPDT